MEIGYNFLLRQYLENIKDRGGGRRRGEEVEENGEKEEDEEM